LTGYSIDSHMPYVPFASIPAQPRPFSPPSLQALLETEG
jgi:hypothetical protein